MGMKIEPQEHMAVSIRKYHYFHQGMENLLLTQLLDATMQETHDPMFHSHILSM